MALISGVTLQPVLDGIMVAQPHAFAQVGSDLYFAYQDMNRHGILAKSSDDGATWSTVTDYGILAYITLTPTSDGGYTVVASTGNNTFVYRNGALVSSGASIGLAVCMWPYIFQLNGPVIYDLGAGWGVSLNATTRPTYQVIGYGAQPKTVTIIAASNFDIGPGWTRPAPAVFHSGTLQFLTNWPGNESATYSGYLSFQDFAGVGTGGNGSAFDVSTSNTRGTFYRGTTVDETVIADKGLAAPHKTAFGALVEDTQLAFFVDKNGLLGSTISTSVVASVDSAGQATTFGAAKVYGNNSALYPTPYSYGASVQSDGLTVFMLAKPYVAQNLPVNYGNYAQLLYRFNDPSPLDRPRSANTDLLSAVTVFDQALPTTPDATQTNLLSRSLGTIRASTIPASYDLAALAQACAGDDLLSNPNGSAGCSPILRAFLNQTGVAYSLVREVARDGDPNSHQGGNAIDVAGPSSPTFTTGGSLSAQASTEMAALVGVLRQVPELFACVIHYDPNASGNCLYIWNGAIVTAAKFGGVSSALVQNSVSNIHISSSKARLLRGFNSARVSAALGVTDSYTDSSGTSTANTVVDPFTADRYVYVNDDTYYGNTTEGVAGAQAGHTVHWW